MQMPTWQELEKGYSLYQECSPALPVTLMIIGITLLLIVFLYSSIRNRNFTSLMILLATALVAGGFLIQYSRWKDDSKLILLFAKETGLDQRGTTLLDKMLTPKDSDSHVEKDLPEQQDRQDIEDKPEQ